MTTSPPELSSLTLNPQRQRSSQDVYDTAYDRFQHFQTSPAVVPSPGQRRGLPAAWMGDHEQPAPPDARSLSPPQTSDLSSRGGSPPPVNHLQPPSVAGQGAPLGADDEIIPTAIVIKNIPFNVKRESLLEIIASLAIPTPYAFNYHLDPAGQFRGLAFANFRVAADADAVVAALNGFDVQGRKLRVEYKKVLQAGEKERIEREKAIRRMRSMQMEKDHLSGAGNAMNTSIGGYDEGYSPLQAPPMNQSRSFSGTLPVHLQGQAPPHMPPMPVPQPYAASQQATLASLLGAAKLQAGQTELDLNDPATLEIYSRILLFKDDHMRDELAFSRSLNPKQRRIVHLVAQKLGVYHYSVGEGEERYAVVTRREPDRNGSNSVSGIGNGTGGLDRGPIRHHSSQALSRSFLSPSSSTGSTNMFATSTSPSSYNQVVAGGLRSKKSMPDMKSLYTPAPRLASRASNGNIREGYATFSSPIRRTPNGPAIGQIFEGSEGIPPVPSMSMSSEGSTGTPNAAAVVRQPRGPGATGFVRRRESAIGPTDRISGGLDARTHEPLEI